MINNYILESLKINNPKNLNEFENVLREISQKIILYALSGTSFFKNAAFYGGTYLNELSLKTNFIKDNIEKVLRLTEILKYINYESIYKEKFALKGGTVIKKLQAKNLKFF